MTKLDGSEIIKVILDAGHGKKTPGKETPDGMKEFEFNVVVTEIARKLLLQYQNVQVEFSHDPSGNIDIDRMKRVKHANEWGADVFVSVHANAFGAGGWNSADGIETYIDPSKPKEALALATKVQRNLVRVTGRDNRGVKTAKFDVVHFTKMTAILVECGFMTNKEEAALLKTQAYREKCAQAIVDGLVEQYGLKLKPVPKPAPKKAAAAAPPAKGYYVQVGYFTNRANAENLEKLLEAKGFDAIIKPV